MKTIVDMTDLQLMTMKRQYERRMVRVQEMLNDVHRPVGARQLVDDILEGQKVVEDEITRRTT